MELTRIFVLVSATLLLAIGAAGCRERPKPGEFVLDRYQGTTYMLLSYPSASDPLYKKFKSDPERVRRVFLHEFECPAVIVVVGGKSGEVFDGPLLDDKSVKHLVDTYTLDPSVVTVLTVLNDGKEADRMTGEKEANRILGQL